MPHELLGDTTHLKILDPCVGREFKAYIYLHNGLNAESILVSPLAGTVQIVTALYLLHKYAKMHQR